MKLYAELRRLENGSSLHETPTGLGIVRFSVSCPFGSGRVLERAKKIMGVIVASAAAEWYPVERWTAQLPEWFISACAPELTASEMEAYLLHWRSLPAEKQEELDRNQRWALPDWLYWMSPENRKWRWWDAHDLADSDQIAVAVEVDEWPFAWGSLRWLFQACGATDVVAEEDGDIA